MQDLYEIAKIPMLIIDQFGVVKSCNTYFSKLSHILPCDIIGKKIFAIDFENKSGELKLVSDENTDVQIINKCFSEFHLRKVPLSHHENRFLIVFDKTNNQNEKSVGENTDKQISSDTIRNSKLMTLARLANGVGHEINNPLAILKGATKAVTDQLTRDGNPSGEKLIEHIENSVARIQRIVSSLKRFSSPDLYDSGSEDNQERGSLRQTVFDLLTLHAASIRNKGIHLVLDLDHAPDTEVPIIDAELIILNILFNAVEAIQGANQLTKKPTIEMAIEEKEQMIRVRISNNGPQIGKKEQEIIFEPFFSSKEKSTHPGMGLSVSNYLISKQGGKVELVQDNNMTHFVLSFPISQSEKLKESA